MNSGSGDARLAAEQRARVLTDRQLADAGSSVQDKKVLVRETVAAMPQREAMTVGTCCALAFWGPLR